MATAPLLHDEGSDPHKQYPLSPGLIGAINNQGKKPRRLSKVVLNRLERLSWSGDDVDILIRIRGGKVYQTAHTLYYTYTSEED